MEKKSINLNELVSTDDFSALNVNELMQVEGGVMDSLTGCSGSVCSGGGGITCSATSAITCNGAAAI